jgi:drug/metabolite transporter (DMT)-like permease
VFWLPVAGWDVAAHGWPPVTPWSAVAIAYLSIGLTIVGYWIWFFALQRVDAGRVGLTIFVQPLFGALLSIWLLGEPLTVATAAGGALVLASLALALRPERMRSQGRCGKFR